MRLSREENAILYLTVCTVCAVMIITVVQRYKPLDFLTREPQWRLLDSGREAKELMVFVKGAVATPGLYRLAYGSRVAHAVNAARILPDAAPGELALAEFIADGDTIDVPRVQRKQ